LKLSTKMRGKKTGGEPAGSGRGKKPGSGRPSMRMTARAAD